LATVISSLIINNRGRNKYQMYFRDFKDQKVENPKRQKHKNINYLIKLNNKKEKRMY
jgi:uncharacterized membrane protein